jgi:uncharacterized repeat protein (TIGR01451 family)
MRGRYRKRAAVGAIGLVAAALAAWAVTASAQYSGEPRSFPNGPSKSLPESAGDALLAPLKLPDDPNVEPAQFTRPAGLSSGTASARTVTDPPTPMVRIQVRVPADSPPDDDIKYLITVQNVSQADAHQVVVRNPLPDGATVVKAEPKWDEKLSDAKQLFWNLGSLKPNESKTIELVLRHKPGAKEIENLAYVRFEHGEKVKTRINPPDVKVSKSAPKQTVRDEPYTVRVVVENTSRVHAEAVRVVENVEKSSDVEAITAGAKRTKADENQWAWEFPKLLPGEKRVIEYRVTPRQAGQSLTTTHTEAGKGVLVKAESRTLVLVPGLKVELTGPTGVVQAGETAKYEITVRNTGTLPSTNVKVVGTVPADCKPTMKTDGGQVYKDQITWTVPRLEPGEAQSFRFGLRASTTGRRVVRASAQDTRRTSDAKDLAVVFQGFAALSWETEPNPVSLAVGRQGTFSVRVKNTGGEAARNVRVEVDVPAEVSLVQVTPNIRAETRTLKFAAEVIEPYGEKLYTITYRAEQSAQAWFKVKMTAEVLGDRPMQTEKAVEITGSK